MLERASGLLRGWLFDWSAGWGCVSHRRICRIAQTWKRQRSCDMVFFAFVGVVSIKVILHRVCPSLDNLQFVHCPDGTTTFPRE